MKGSTRGDGKEETKGVFLPKAKLSGANKCLFVIRGLRKEGYRQKDVDLLFKSIVLSKLT